VQQTSKLEFGKHVLENTQQITGRGSKNDPADQDRSAEVELWCHQRTQANDATFEIIVKVRQKRS